MTGSSIKELPFFDCDETESDTSPSVTKPSQIDPVHFDCLKAKGLHYVHINARSLLPKLDELRILLTRARVAVLAVTETWLDDSVTDEELKIPGYQVVRKDRDRHGGGVCLYINSDIPFNPRSDLDCDGLEAKWIDLYLPKTKPITIGVVYRPPKQNNFIDLFESVLSNFTQDNEHVVLGDFNICFSHGGTKLFRDYTNILHVFGFRQIINTFTRVTCKTSTILDHILVSQSEKICQKGVIPVGISDHFITYCTRKVVRGQFNRHNIVKIRSMKNYCKESLLSELRKIDFSVVTNQNDVHVAWSNFKNIMSEVIEMLAPCKEIRVKQRSEPWITGEIIGKIHERDKMLYMSRKSKNEEHHKCFCMLRNQVSRLVKKAKRDYLSQKIEDCKNDPKGLWQQLKRLGYSNKSKEEGHIVLKINDKIEYDPVTIGNHVNTFFTTIANKLVSKLPHVPSLYTVDSQTFLDFYRDVEKGKLKLCKVSVDFVSKELQSLNPNKSTGLDNISPRFLKDGAVFLAEPVTHIVNLSISTCQVPADFKTARVKPLFKKNSKLEVGNYRPVSILPIMSKILEKSVYVQVEKYLKDNNLLFQHQSGFRSSFSTDTCLIYLSDLIRSEMSQGKIVGLVALDVQKAFDCVNHQILCSKLYHMGIDPSWFSAYLSNRQQTVLVNNVYSSKANIECGVPQGSLLGPLLYLCYCNDLQTSVSCKLVMYADDTILVASDKDPSVVSDVLASNLQSCNNWLVNNNLSLHMGKTECIIFGTKRRLRKVGNFSVKCLGHEIKPQAKIKYLGAVLDQHMSGDVTVNNITSKTNAKLKFMYRYANILNMASRKTLCSALIQCHFDYSISSWYSGLSVKSKAKLKVLQNKMVRFILNLNPRAHVGQAQRAKAGFLELNDRATQLKMGIVHNIFHDKCPQYLKDHFTKVTDVHHHNTRSNRNFHVPHVNSVTKNTFYFSSITAWNSLPNNIKAINSKDSFKKSLKLHLVNSAILRENSDFVYY